MELDLCVFHAHKPNMDDNVDCSDSIVRSAGIADAFVSSSRADPEPGFGAVFSVAVSLWLLIVEV